MNQYDFARQFCSSNDMMPYFQYPCVINRNNVKTVAATNVYCIVAFPEKDGSVSTYEESLEKKFIPVLDGQPLLDAPRTIQACELRKAIESLPLIPEMDGEEVECSNCEGEGVVECKECGHEYKCPKCHGEGIIDKSKPTGRMITDLDKHVRLGNSVFRGHRIQEMLKAVDYANVDVISHVRGNDRFQPTTLLIGEIEILVMPCAVDEDDSVYFTIKYND